MHAYSTEDPVFVAMNKRGQEETNGELGTFCVNCHAPMAVRENAFADSGADKFANVAALPAPLKGVTCYFCHNATGVGEPHNNGNLTLANDDVMRGAISNALEPSVHKVAYSEFHDATKPQSSLMCGTCHDIVTPRGLHLERTYEEYADSIQAQPGSQFQSCQDCHMGRNENPQVIATKTGRPGELTNNRTLHPHLWPAVDLPLTEWPHADAMRSAVEQCELKRTISYRTLELMPGPIGQLRIALESEAGHKIPSGAAQDRRMWVELTGYDANNNELFALGRIPEQAVEEPDGEPHPCMFREYMLDESGAETHDFWEGASLDRARGQLLPYKKIGSSLIPGDHSAECVFQPPLSAAIEPAHHVEMHIRMRPMGMDVLNDLVSTGHLSPDIPPRMHTLSVERWTFVFKPESQLYERIPSADGDCATWVCMIDPQSSACAKSQRRAAQAVNSAGGAGSQAAVSPSSNAAAAVAPAAGAAAP
jgi:nitrate/TMAO reductase-like tetraheme cytochrome c subunit